MSKPVVLDSIGSLMDGLMFDGLEDYIREQSKEFNRLRLAVKNVMPVNGRLVNEITKDELSKDDLWREITKLQKELHAAKEANVALEAVRDGKAIGDKPILVINGILTVDDVDEIAEVWREKQPDGVVFCLPNDVKIESLSDDELASIGLKRIKKQTNEREDYEAMLCGK